MHLVIIGNSAAGINALENFRKYDTDSKITIISREGKPVYSRVLLPYFLRKKIDRKTLFIRDENFYDKFGADFVADTVVNVDTAQKQVDLKGGRELSYDKLLIASGSNAVMPPIEGISGPNIHNLWTLEDVNNLEPMFEAGKRILVLGSGFVSLQAAWAALANKMEVTVYEILPRIMNLVLDNISAEKLGGKIRQLGVTLETEVHTTKIETLNDGSLKVYAKDRDPAVFDLIIVGTGVRSNVAFLDDSEVKIDRGILVDQYMATNVRDVYAAGDVAQGPDAFGNDHITHALWPTAVEMGQTAGKNLAGHKGAYLGSLNMNVTQMFDLTVGSMGKFLEDEGNSFIEREDDLGYLKIKFKDKLPIGGVIVGHSDLVKYLGVLRPFIRNEIEIRDEVKTPEDLFEILHGAMVSQGSLKMAEVR